jgi:hemolysin III
MNQRIRRIFRDPFCGMSHLLGALLSIAGLVVLLVAAAGRPWHVVGFSIYGASLVLLFSASSLAHSLHCSPATGAKLDRLDYAAIFLLIAGTYTPLCLVNLRGPWGWTLLGLEWGLAVVGISTVLRGGARANGFRTLVYLAMGWLVLIAAYPVLTILPTGGITWLMIGGAFYTIGAAIFFTDWPHLIRGRFAAHDLWHCMVLAGSACHYMVMLQYVA